MAVRLLFTPKKDRIGVDIQEIKFEYFSGYSLSQKQKSIISLHKECEKLGYKKILEVSTKSTVSLGVALSAFNLSTKTVQRGHIFSVEQAFQASKVFEKGGPYVDLLDKTSREAKLDTRLKTSGKLLYFKFYNMQFDRNPPTAFYDWLYINVLMKNPGLIEQLENYDNFTDIEFNQNKSINCQAYSVALFKSLIDHKVDLELLKDSDKVKEFCREEYIQRWMSDSINIQSELFDSNF